MTVRDMYADLEKIEERGKRKKEKRGGLFSSFGKKDEPEPDSETRVEETPKPAPPPKSAAEPVAEKKAPEPAPVSHQPTPAAKPFFERKTPEPAKETPRPVSASPSPKPAIEPVKAAPVAPPQPMKAEPVAEEPETWKPLSGGKLKKAEEELLAYKKWLNKGYKSGVMTKEQCTAMVRAKEIELGLMPPE